jgi:hypothetical protein
MQAVGNVGVVLTLILSAVPAMAATVIIQSSPSGAEATIDGEARGKTPLRLRLSEGEHVLELAEASYRPYSKQLKVGTRLLVHKAKMRPVTFPVDILFVDMEEEGWVVFDGEEIVVTSDGKLVSVPATVPLPKGTRKIALMKDGFADIVISVNVDPEAEGAIVEIKNKPKRGKSSLDKCLMAFVVGTWRGERGTLIVKEGGEVQIMTTDGDHRPGTAHIIVDGGAIRLAMAFRDNLRGAITVTGPTAISGMFGLMNREE